MRDKCSKRENAVPTMCSEGKDGDVEHSAENQDLERKRSLHTVRWGPG